MIWFGTDLAARDVFFRRAWPGHNAPPPVTTHDDNDDADEGKEVDGRG